MRAVAHSPSLPGGGKRVVVAVPDSSVDLSGLRGIVADLSCRRRGLRYRLQCLVRRLGLWSGSDIIVPRSAAGRSVVRPVLPAIAVLLAIATAATALVVRFDQTAGQSPVSGMPTAERATVTAKDDQSALALNPAVDPGRDDSGGSSAGSTSLPGQPGEAAPLGQVLGESAAPVAVAHGDADARSEAVLAIRAPATVPAPTLAPTVLPPVDTPTPPPSAVTTRVESKAKGARAAVSPVAPGVFVAAWARAWAEQRVGDYLAHYASDFSGNSHTKASAWRDERRQRVSAPSAIRVEVSDFEVIRASDRSAEVRFVQDYSADHYSDRVLKYLSLRRSGDTWVITREWSELPRG
ncbi:MAG: L,D-transpeptidase Cds6 family protein [Gammaproteobacteria bacterium]